MDVNTGRAALRWTTEREMLDTATLPTAASALPRPTVRDQGGNGSDFPLYYVGRFLPGLWPVGSCLGALAVALMQGLSRASITGGAEPGVGPGVGPTYCGL